MKRHFGFSGTLFGDHESLNRSHRYSSVMFENVICAGTGLCQVADSFPKPWHGWAEEQRAGWVFARHPTQDFVRMENLWRYQKHPKVQKSASQNLRAGFSFLKCPILVCWPAVEIAKACSRHPRKLCFSVLKNRSWFCIAPGSRSEASSWLNQNSVQLHYVALTVLKTAPGLTISFSTGRKPGSEFTNVYLI